MGKLLSRYIYKDVMLAYRIDGRNWWSYGIIKKGEVRNNELEKIFSHYARLT